MDNVEKLVNTHDFTVEQTVKEFKILVTPIPCNCSLARLTQCVAARSRQECHQLRSLQGWLGKEADKD